MALDMRVQAKLLHVVDIEREYILEVLSQARGKKAKAAAVLGIIRKTLLEKRKKYVLG